MIEFAANVKGDAESVRVRLRFEGSVLHLRGDAPTRQPLTSRNQANNTSAESLMDGGMESLVVSGASESVLCWNGEIFAGIAVPEHENDGQVLFRLLCACQTDSQVMELLGRIEGEWAVVFYHGELQKVWFGRDFCGRRSLTWLFEDSRVVVSSVAYSDTKSQDLLDIAEAGEEEGVEGDDPEENGCLFKEVAAKGLHTLDIRQLLALQEVASVKSALDWHPWGVSPSLPLPFRKMNSTIPTEADLKSDANNLAERADELLQLMTEAVRVRVTGVPDYHCNAGDSRLGILFSGGIDSMVMAALADRCLPLDEPLDLINVAFAVISPLEDERPSNPKQMKGKNRTTAGRSPFDVPDRITGLAGLEELRALSPNRLWRFVEVNVPADELDEIQTRVRKLMFPSQTVLDLSIATALWCASRGVGKGFFFLSKM